MHQNLISFMVKYCVEKYCVEKGFYTLPKIADTIRKLRCFDSYFSWPDVRPGRVDVQVQVSPVHPGVLGLRRPQRLWRQFRRRSLQWVSFIILKSHYFYVWRRRETPLSVNKWETTRTFFAKQSRKEKPCSQVWSLFTSLRGSFVDQKAVSNPLKSLCVLLSSKLSDITQCRGAAEEFPPPLRNRLDMAAAEPQSFRWFQLCVID